MIRSTLRRGLRKAIGAARGRPSVSPDDVTRAWQAETASVPADRAAEAPAEVPTVETPPAEEVSVASPEPEAELQPEAEPEAELQPEAEPAKDAPVAALTAEDDTAGMPLTEENVQEILDDMVRPALQGDGGDISLVKIEDNDVYVKLVGACNTCPSATATMKMGVEALFREEFPTMGDLIQVE